MEPAKLYQEDINRLTLELLGSYPLLACKLTEEDEDVIINIIERFLDPFSYGYSNYN